MKKCLSLLLTAAILISLVACTSNTADSAVKESQSTSSSTSKNGDSTATERTNRFAQAFQDFSQYRKEGETFTVLYAVSWAAAEYFVNSYEAWAPILEEVGITLVMQGPEAPTVESQLSLIESALLSAQYDAIILYPVAGDVFTPYMQQWWDTYGVPIICFGYPAESASGHYVVSAVSYYTMGEVVGYAILDYVEKNADYFDTLDTIPVAVLRQVTNIEEAHTVEGMLDVITAADSRFTIVEDHEQVDISRAVGVVETMLVSHPEVEIIIAQTDDLAVATNTALEAAVGISEYVSVWGSGGSASAVQNIAAGGFIKGTSAIPLAVIGEFWEYYLPIVIGAAKEGIIIENLDDAIPVDEAFLVTITQDNAQELIK